jgi:dTDP-4-amino-4,6-dideoxygalactose transaminase
MYRIGEEEIEELRRVIAGKKLFRLGDPAKGHQQEVERFEREWAETIGAQYALCLSGGGTAALICGLAALGIGPGDEVIVPAYTWMATATAALSVGAIPVIAEVDETLALDPDDVERKITPQTRALIPVHMVGRPANLERLLQIARTYTLALVEDASQADGGSYKGRRLGSWGDVGAFSFNDFKILSCGEGGALVTDDRTLYDRAAIYHDSLTSFPTFSRGFTVPTFVGMQFRASEIMGAILRVQLQRLEGILRDLRGIKKRFEEELCGVPNLRIAPNNDPEGDCGVVVAFQFDGEESARRFAAAPGVKGGLPIDTDRHVYANWAPVLEKRIGHHPDMNPFNHPRNQGLGTEYSPDMCPRTLDILRRTVYVRPDPDWSEADVLQRIAACRKAAQGL